MAKLAGKDPVPFWRLFLRMGGWLPLVFALPLLILTIISSHQLGLAERFEREGRQSVATVVDRYTRVTTDSDGDRKTTYYLEMTFTTQAGEAEKVRRSVGSSIYRATQVGDELPIWYLETEPDRTELRQGEHRTGSRVAQGIGLLLGLFALGSGWHVGRKAVAAVRARSYGAREVAVVTGIRRTAMKVNNKPRYRLTWREASGREGESMVHRRRDLEEFEPGAEIGVYQGLKRAWWVGDVGERAEG